MPTKVDAAEILHDVAVLAKALRRHAATSKAHIGNARGGLWPRQRARRPGHCQQLRAILQAGIESGVQALCKALAFGNQLCRAGFHQHLGVARLMVVHGIWKRDKDRRDAGGTDLGNGQGTGATDNKICPGIGGCHVGNEGLDIRIQESHRIRFARALQMAGAALVTNGQPVHCGEAAQHLRQNGIEALCTLAPAQHQQPQRSR
jgi:hypothetical protein